MRAFNQCIMVIAIAFSHAPSAPAERLWEGHIEIKTGWAGKFDQAGFNFVPNNDDPFQVTLNGNIYVVVDSWSAETRKLRLVRKTRYS
jgi:hypothetical protein